MLIVIIATVATLWITSSIVLCVALAKAASEPIPGQGQKRTGAADRNLLLSEVTQIETEEPLPKIIFAPFGP